jgi:hypothetical protein
MTDGHKTNECIKLRRAKAGFIYIHPLLSYVVLIMATCVSSTLPLTVIPTALLLDKTQILPGEPIQTRACSPSIVSVQAIGFIGYLSSFQQMKDP